MNNDCLFCKIANEQTNESIIYTDDDFTAVFDIFPNTKGQVVIISKKHSRSDIFKSDFELVHKGVDVAKKLAELLDKTFKPDRVCLITEGIFIDHLHLKLYPVYDVNKYDNSLRETPVFFDKFPGYITTQSGAKIDDAELARLVGEVRKLCG
jgi:diadenosine tetraphosphate (Ap4A) HIT family hydrolase